MKSIKYIPIVLAGFLPACNDYDIQPEQAEGFIKFFTTGLAEQGYDVKPASDGGYVAVGTTSDNEGIRDIYLVKTDRYGNEESWSPAIIGGESDDVATSLQVVSDGYVLLGYSNDTDGAGSYDMYLVKTDLQGNVLWEQYVGGSSDDRGTNLQLLSGGGFLAGGITSSFGVPGTRYAYLVTFDTQGNVTDLNYSGEEGKTINGTYAVETSSEYVICGSIQSGLSQIFVYTFNKQNLGPENSKYFGTVTDHYGSCIQVLSDGNLVLCGSAVNDQGFSEIYLQKLAPDLSSIWVRKISEPQADLAGNALRIAPDNSIAVVGTRTKTENDDLFLLFTDSEGNNPDLTFFGDDGYQRGNSLEPTTVDNGWIVVGTNGFEDQSMMSLMKTDPQGSL